jgi:hypothetical protein
MQEIRSHETRGTVLVVNNASGLDLHLEAICRFGNESQQRFRFLPSDEEIAGGLKIVDAIERGRLFEVDTQGAQISAAYLSAAVQLLRLSRREYFTCVGMIAGLGMLALRTSAYLQPEDLEPAEHEHCLLSPASGTRDMLSRIDNLLFCPNCADFYCALGLENEVTACQQLIGVIDERRSQRSIHRWNKIGMERPPVRRL